MIDLSMLPKRVAVDTSFFIHTREGARQPGAEICAAVWAALTASPTEIVIPTPVLSEFVHKPPHAPPPRKRRIEIGAFDETAALEFGSGALRETWPKQAGYSKRAVKYDFLILACALRHGAEAIISTDDNQLAWAGKVGLLAVSPKDLLVSTPVPAQGKLFL